MNSDNRHIINKISAELTLSTPAPQDEMSEQLKAAIRSALENIREMLDRNFSDSFYRVNHLSIELDLKEADLPQLARLLERALTEKIMNAERHKDSVQSASKQVFEKMAPEDRMKELVVYFLQTGQFPWWAARESFTGIEDWADRVSPKDWLDTIKPLIYKYPGVLKRVAAQFPEHMVHRLIRLSSARESSADKILLLLEKMWRFLESRKLAYGQYRKIRTRLYKEALAGLILDKPEHNLLISLISDALDVVSETDKDAEKDWKKWLHHSVKDKDYWIELSHEASSKPGNDPEEKEENRQDVENSQFIEEADFPVPNAGLVLLHPFWEHLFKNLGLLQDGVFVKEATRERAVCLLHYLATGREEFPEQELILPKFLCGWPLGRPVNRFLPVSDYEKEECASLMKSAIDHWDVLKNTSIKGLQSNFLQRKGVLKEEVFGWSLYVEQKTQDVLLEKLPWGLSVLKYVWMDDMLTIHW